MISIRRLLERPDTAAAGSELLEASSQLRGLLLAAIADRAQCGKEAETGIFDLSVRDLLRRLEAAAAPMDLATIATQALRAVEHFTRRTTEHLREQGSQMQSMVAMLTDTLADVSGQSEASIARLQAIERQIERASSLDDIPALRASLASCLAGVKEAAVQQRKAAVTTVERLHDHIKSLPQSPIGVAAPSGGTRPPPAGTAEYVAAFKLQRADNILTRFGEGVRDQMLSVIAEGLRSVQGTRDRLMQWKGASFVMLLNSSESVAALQRRYSAVVAKIGQRYVEVGKNSALLAVGVDWVVYPQARYPSLEAVFGEVDAFLSGEARNEKKTASETAQVVPADGELAK